MNIGIIGTGYVGIVTGACFADLGNQVICYDIDEEKISTYLKGKSPIYEPGLEELLKKNISNGNLSFTTKMEELVHKGDILFICVGTPPLPDGSADLSQVETAVRAIAQDTPAGVYRIIVEKSTVPVGTHKRLKIITKLYNKEKSEFDFVVNSEFLKEGTAVTDFMNPDRIVIGVESKRAQDEMLKLYEKFNTKKLVVDPASAEIIKYASNSFLALKISFINMVADLCEKAGGDIEKVADGIGCDVRIGRAFLNAGIGYGGSCFPKDVKAFINVMEDYFVDNSILKSVDSFNASRSKKVIDILEEELWILKNKDIAIWGLSFKPETDDIREAPSLKIVSELLEKDVRLKLYDPKAMKNFKSVFPESKMLSYFDSAMDTIKNCDALVILTEWEEFKKKEPKEIYKLLKVPVVIDGRNVLNSQEMTKLGFRYFPIGKGQILKEMKNNNV